MFKDTYLDGFRVRLFHINGLKLGVALDIGPRILYLGLMDEDFNLFNIVPDIQRETPDGVWRIYGGHRLWTAPEDFPRTYSLDDKPVDIDLRGNTVTITGNPEAENNVLKRIRIEPGDKEHSLKVTHEVVNIGRWPLEYACWALSVMKPSGLAIIPLKPKPVDKHGLLPDRVISIWPYTRLNDSRLILAEDNLMIRHDPSITQPLKIGARANPPVVAYWLNEYLFLKHIRVENGKYPDYGVTVEVYADDKIIELETLGPLRYVKPGESNIHVEEWEIRELKAPSIDYVLSEVSRPHN
jgi:hypothetical protein